MLQRAITGTFYVLAIVSSVFFGGWYLHILFGLVALLMLQEFTKMFEKSEFSPNPILTPILGLIIYVFGIYSLTASPSEGAAPVWLPLLLLSFFAFIWIALIELFRNKKNPFANLSISFGGIVYAVLPLLLINYMSVSGKETDTIFPLLGIFIMIWCSDTFAYLVGRKIGKHKMFERISPNKSWEGFFGGMTFAILAGIIMAYSLEGQPYIEYAIYGMIAASFGTLGDLIESMLKRSLNLKDSGKILPGHGGLLDRLDSVLVVIPVIFVCQLILFYYFN
jgi:phosphatidate cytidylyltransferase